MRHRFWPKAMLALALVCSTYAWAQQKGPIDPDRIAAAKELMDATGATKSMEVMVNIMAEQLKPLMLRAYPGKEKEVSEGIEVMVKRMHQNSNELLEAILPLYAERFSVAEMREVIAFAKSPTGAKFVAASPEISQQSAAIGNAWGRRIGMEAAKEIQSRIPNPEEHK
jgi:uncharacterized protein